MWQTEDRCQRDPKWVNRGESSDEAIVVVVVADPYPNEIRAIFYGQHTMIQSDSG